MEHRTKAAEAGEQFA